MNDQTFYLSLFGIVGFSYCVPIGDLQINNDNIIPLIIGLSLMGFVIVILLASLCVCFIINKTSPDKKTHDENKAHPENVKLLEFVHKNSIELADDKKKQTTKQTNESQNKSIENLENISNTTTKGYPKIHRYRRASVPAVLSTLHEASPSLEASSRKMSLSYNCVLEPQYDTKRNTIAHIEIDDIGMPESGPGTELNSRQNSNDKESELKIKKYSIYNDSDFFPIKEISKYGQITFSLYYDWISKTLEVTINQAKYLMGFGTKRKNHFYVKVLLKTKNCPQYTSTNSLSGVPDKNINKFHKSLKGSFRTAIKSDFCNPVFDETFKFTSITSLLLKECILQLIVKEETPKFLEKNIVLGCVDFALDEAGLVDKHESLNEIIRDIKPVQQIEEKGKVILSLNYNRQLTVLTVTIKELLPGPEQVSDVSVELFLRSIDSIMYSRKLELDSSLKSSNGENFDLDTCLVNSVCLVLVFYGRIRNCSKTPLGRLVVGPIQFASGARLAHWAEMSFGNEDSIKMHDII